MTLKRKIIKHGGSYGITIPKAIIEGLKLKVGDEITVKIILENKKK